MSVEKSDLKLASLRDIADKLAVTVRQTAQQRFVLQGVHEGYKGAHRITLGVVGIVDERNRGGEMSDGDWQAAKRALADVTRVLENKIRASYDEQKLAEGKADGLLLAALQTADMIAAEEKNRERKAEQAAAVEAGKSASDVAKEKDAARKTPRKPRKSRAKTTTRKTAAKRNGA